MSARDPPDPDDPIQYFIEEMELSGKADQTVQNYRTALNYLEDYLDDHGYAAGELTERQCKQLIQFLKNADSLSNTTAGTYAQAIDRFFQFYNTRGTFEVNPMALAREHQEIGNDTSDLRRDVSVVEMAEFLEWLSHPLTYATSFTMAKTGMRVGELSNLDVRDVYLDHPGVRREYGDHRPALDGRPDSLYVESNSTMYEGAVVNGEERTASNKRERATVIPIDEELKQVLVFWMAVRSPARSDADPLFTVTAGKNGTRAGDRVSIDLVRDRLVRQAEAYGWWEKGAGVETNVTPHYFRHFFTTHMRNRTKDDAFVKFIRGDVGDDILDTYTHAWGDKVEETYRENIYSLLR